MCRYWIFPFWGFSEVLLRFLICWSGLSQKHTLSPCVRKMLVVYWNLLKVYPKITWMSRMTFIRIGKYSSDHGFINVLLHTTSFVFVFCTISPIMCSLRGYWWKLLVLSSKWLPLPTDPLPAGAKRFLDSWFMYIHVILFYIVYHLYIIYFLESTMYICIFIRIFLQLQHTFARKNNCPQAINSAPQVWVKKRMNFTRDSAKVHDPWKMYLGTRYCSVVWWDQSCKVFFCWGKTIPYHPSMVYLPTFTINLGQM